jgi:excinuclease ABC subunit C
MSITVTAKEISLFGELRDKVKEFPLTPGVYLMKSKVGKIIYVGKAKQLRNRVRSYFSESQELSPKTKLLVKNICAVDYILTKTEVEAFLLEASLIKKHRPKYNIRLKDDKTYPYIKFSAGDPFPRLYLARKVKKDGGQYFGPYTKGSAVFGTIRFLNQTFSVRDCTDSVFKTRKRPCLTHQIGRCSAPCVGLVDRNQYGIEIAGALSFLKGRDKGIVKQLNAQMKQSALEEKFEVAARLRDSIRSVQAVLEKQSVIDANSEMDQDAVGYFGDDRGTLIQTLHVRQGRVIGSRSHFFPLLNSSDANEDAREWVLSFLNQYYEENVIPDDVLLPIELGRDLTKLFEAVLVERGGGKVSVRYPTDSKGRNLVEMANQNAESQFSRHVEKSVEKEEGLLLIQKKLGLKNRPTRIECFDISTFQGSETVASQVVFEDGVASKDHYRRYRIKTVIGTDDFASMHEVLTRRFKHEEMEKPDLVVIDGGKGQLQIATRVLSELGIEDVPVVGLAKARTKGSFQDEEVSATEERFYLPGRANPVLFRVGSEAFQILVGIRDEAHRFAITYHRKIREASSLESELDSVVGLGEEKRKELLKKFGHVDALREASVEELSQVPGIGKALAEKILLHLREPAQGAEKDSDNV